MATDFWQPIRAHWAQRAAGQAPPDPATLSLGEYADRRADYGVSSTSDFVGVEAWTRPKHFVHREPTAMDSWAEERTAAGVPDAPDASCGDVRINPSAWQII